MKLSWKVGEVSGPAQHSNNDLLVCNLRSARLRMIIIYHSSIYYYFLT